MSDRFDINVQDMYNDYVTAQALGSAMLSCNGMLVPVGMPEYALLIKSFPYPVMTRHDPAEVNYAGGFQTGVASIPKVYYEGSITLIETDSGQGTTFAEWANLVAEHDFIMYKGRVDRNMQAFHLLKCKLTFENGEIDSENRSSILTLSGSIKYNYFGTTVNTGVSSSGAVTDMQNNTIANFANTANSTLNSIFTGSKMGAVVSAGYSKGGFSIGASAGIAG